VSQHNNSKELLDILKGSFVTLNIVDLLVTYFFYHLDVEGNPLAVLLYSSMGVFGLILLKVLMVSISFWFFKRYPHWLQIFVYTVLSLILLGAVIWWFVVILAFIP